MKWLEEAELPTAVDKELAENNPMLAGEQQASAGP